MAIISPTEFLFSLQSKVCRGLFTITLCVFKQETCTMLQNIPLIIQINSQGNGTYFQEKRKKCFRKKHLTRYFAIRPNCV